jgi:hypothetical protein
MNMKRKTKCFLLCLTIYACASATLAAEDTGSSGGGTDWERSLERLVEEAPRVAEEWLNRISSARGKAPDGPWVGVAVEAVPDALRAHLPIAEGAGLLVLQVIGGGPAEAAGVLKNDILLEFNGQILFNPSQLSGLVKLNGSEEEARLKVLRTGQPVELKITPKERPVRAGGKRAPDAPVPPEAPAIPQGMREDLDNMLQGIEDWIPGSVRVLIDEEEQVRVDLDDLKQDLHALRSRLLQSAQGVSSAEKIVEQHGTQGARTTTIHMDEELLNFHSSSGSLEISQTNEGRTVTIRDTEGNALYAGEWPEDAGSDLPAAALAVWQAFEDGQAHMERELEDGSVSIPVEITEQPAIPQL